MAQFPIRQTGILGLARDIIGGLGAHAAVYPAPPVPVADLQTAYDQCSDAVSAVNDARASFEIAVRDKDQRLADLKDKMRKVLRYAENTVGDDDDKLAYIGWAGKRPPTSVVPGQVRELKVLEQGTDWLQLDWKSPDPAQGGKVSAYKIQRRDMNDADLWGDTAVAIDTKAKLTGQQRHTDLEYRVVAINKAGQGKVSNTVAVVL